MIEAMDLVGRFYITFGLGMAIGTYLADPVLQRQTVRTKLAACAIIAVLWPFAMLHAVRS